VSERRKFSREAAVPLFIGLLFGFIAGYFAAGGGRPSGGLTSGGAAAPEGSGDRIGELTRALERDPENPELLTALGNAHYDRENWDGAIEAYEKARRKAPRDASLLSDLGAAYRNRGDLRRAVALFRRAREHDPEHWQSLLNLVLVHAFDLRDAAAAQHEFDELKRRYPEIPQLDRIEQQISGLRAGA
jgi:tetratricopeptide (TPR) repeat protein